MANPFDQFDKPAANPFDRFDAVAPVAEAVPDLSVAAEPEGRTAGEWLNDTALMLRRGARNVTSGLLGAPVDLINLAIDPLPARLIRGGFNALGADIKAPAEALGLPGAIEQPELVQGLRESIRRETLADTAATGSTTLAREQQGLAEADGFLETVEYLARNPQALAMFGAEQVPQLVTAIPGRLLATIGLQGVSAGSQAEAQVAEALAAEVEAGRLSPEDAAQIQADVFRASGALNTALPFLPGAQTLERVAALRPLAGRGVVGGAVRGAAGEGTQGVLSEGGDQVIANLATGRPIDEGVGQAAALGLLLEGPLGGLAGGAEGFAAGPVSPSADLGGVVPPQAPIPPVAPAGGVPAPIVPPGPPPAAAEAVEALAPVRPAPVQVPEGATVESVRQQIGQATTDAERRQLAAILGALQEQGAPSPAPQPGAETAQASGGETALPDLASILNDPNIAAALDALAGEQTAPAPADAQAPAVGGSPTAGAAPTRATPEALDRALAMDEDAYIAAVNPEGKRSSAEDEIAFSANDIQAPDDAVAVPEFGFTDRQGKPVTVLEAPDGTLYAQVEGKTVGLVESSNGETLNQVAKEFQGRGIGTGLIRAQMLRDPMTPAGSFSEAGERTRRAAFRQLRAERAPKADLGAVAEPADLGEAAPQVEIPDRAETRAAPAVEPVEQATEPDSEASQGNLPTILTQPRAKAIRDRVKAAKLRPDSPGYAEAVANIEAQYEAEVDAALAQTTFEQYRALNPGTPESVARRAWEALQQQPLGQPGNVRRTMRPPPPAEERAGPSWLEVDAETDALIDRARQEARRLAADTGEIAQRITRELGPNARRHITVVGQWADLPADVRTRAERAGLDERTEGFFDPRTGRVFILADERMTPERAVWVAFHETAGHLGLHAAMRRLAGDGPMLDRLVREFDRAGRNVTVSQIARAIRRQNPDYARLRSIEEALSELAAANRTGNWQEIQTRYGVEVPPSMRAGVRTMLDSILDAIRRFINAVLGRDAGYTDGQVLRLLEDAWRDAQKAGQAARESDAMLSRRAFADGRGQRSIEWNGETWVNRDGEYYLADANGQPRDFFFVREAEAEATRTGGEVRRDDPVDGERQTYSVTLPEGVRMDAEREFVDEGPMFSRRANVDEVTGLPMNDDGTVTVYHHTSADRAEAIRRDGLLRADAEPDVYVTTRAETDTGYGDTAVPIRVDPARLELDDEFPNGRRDFRINVGRPGGSIRVRVENDPESDNILFSRRADQTETPEFKRWFGDSKVVDEQGRPLVVYHGSKSAGFKEFDPSRLGSASGNEGFFGAGFYFTDSESIASGYAGDWDGEDGRANTMRVYLSISNPLRLSESERDYEAALAESRRTLLALDGWTEAERAEFEANDIDFISDAISRIGARRFREVIEANGFDGVHVDGSYGSMNADEWVAFRPEQIKFAGQQAETAGEVGGAGRPTTNSNGQPIHRTKEGVRDFWRWFGDSKVVDADGRPLVVYHGTRRNFDAFVPMSAPGWGTGIYFTDNRAQAADQFGGGEGGRVVEAYVSIKNPWRGGYPGDAAIEGTQAWREASATYEDPLDAWDEDGEFAGQVLRELGYDGVIARDSNDINGLEIVAFDPKQIKSATDNRGTFDPESDNILFSRRGQGDLVPPATEQEQRNAALSNAMARRSGLFGRLAAMGYPQGALTQQPGGEFRPVRKAVDEARRYLQDRMLPLRRAQEAAAGESAPGVTTPTLEDGMNAYRLENLMHGAVADKLRDADERFILRIQRMMKNSGVSADQLQDYLLARHAPERNARIASINPAMPDGGSGITTQEAADIMAGTAPGPYSGKPLDADTRRKAKAIAAVADEMRKETLAYMVKAGQITQQMADTLLKRYPNYVPLRGWKGEDTEAGQRTGRGLQAVRNAIKRALGRRSLPDNLLGELAGDLQRAIVASEKAKVGRALLRFALANPMPDLYTVEPVELEWKFSEATGEAYLGIRNSAEDIERSLVVKADDGTPVRIRFEDDALAQAIVNMNPVDAGGIVRTLGALNRWRSSVLTRYNPGFAPVNMARDALFGVTAISAEKGADVAAATVATYPQALRAMWRDARKARGRTGVPVAQRTWDDWARSFAALGGKTGITRVEDVADLQRKMSEGTATLLELARQGKPWATTREAVGRALKPVADFIEAGNDATENAIRLAVFRQLVLDGTSEQQAAEYAKNVTINFNRKGEWGPALNAVYLFYNASMQGTHAVFRVMRNPKVAGFLGSLAVLQGVLAASMMGEDDDEDGITAWDKVPDYVKRTSLVIPLGWATGNMDDYFALPMPYGFNLFTYGGGRGAQYMVLGERPTDTSIMSDLFTAAMDAFSPVPVTDGPRSVFGETIGFAMGLYGNKDDFGRPIVADRFAKDYVPRALLGRSDTPQIFHMLARASAKLGGGDLDKMIAPVGPLDIAPEQLEAIWNFATGGVGSIFNRSIRASEQMAAGNLEGPMEMVTATPIASRFVARGNTARAIAERYYRDAEEMERNLAVLKERTRQQGVSDFDAILAEIQAEEPAMAGVELDRYKRSGKWGEAGEPKLTDTGAPRLRAAPGSPMESYRLASRETEDLNRLIRQLRVGGQTQAELVRMVDENVAGDTTALEALNLSDYNPEAPATTAQRNRAIKLVQDFRAQQQQEFIRAMNRARQTGRER